MKTLRYEEFLKENSSKTDNEGDKNNLVIDGIDISGIDNPFYYLDRIKEFIHRFNHKLGDTKLLQFNEILLPHKRIYSIIIEIKNIKEYDKVNDIIIKGMLYSRHITDASITIHHKYSNIGTENFTYKVNDSDRLAKRISDSFSNSDDIANVIISKIDTIIEKSSKH